MDIIAYALAKGYTKKAIDDLTKSLGTPLTFKGTVALKTDLPTAGNKIGEIYHVVENKNEYIWMDDNGAQRWEDIGPIMTGVAHINDSVVNENDTWSSKKINDNDIKEISSSIDEEKITTVITKKDNTQITAEALLASPTLITDNQALHKKEMPLRAESVKVNSISGKTEKSKNLFKIKSWLDANNYTYTESNGIFKVSYNVSMPNAEHAFVFSPTDIRVTISGKFKFLGEAEGNLRIEIYNQANQLVKSIVGDYKLPQQVTGNKITFNSNRFGDFEVSIMVNEGTEPLPYDTGYTGLHNAKVTAIKGTTTTAISPEVLGLDSYGCGIDSFNNEVDYTNGKYTRKVKNIVYNGTENWILSGINSYGIANFYTSLPIDAQMSNINKSLSSYYQYDPRGIAQSDTEGFTMSVNAVFFRTSQYSTVETWKAHLAELSAAGNPLELVYIIDPTIIPLVSSAPSVTVSSLGDFELVNEHNIDMPNSIEVTTVLPTPISNEQTLSQKISLPKNPDGTPDYGAAGQILVSDGTGGVTWKDELKVTVTDNPDGTVNLNIQ